MGCLAGTQPAVGILVPASDAGFVTEAGGSAKGDGTVSGAESATYNYSVGRELHYSSGALFLRSRRCFATTISCLI